jgi:hypothetical protein
VETQGHKHSLREDVSATMAVIVDVGTFDEAVEARRRIISMVNDVRDWLKYYKPSVTTKRFDAVEAAQDLIEHATNNYWKLLTKETAEMVRFQEHRVDLSNAHIRRAD